MKFTRATDYAVRLLVHLASKDGEGTSIELSKRLDIPFNHLAKLVQALARKGYLITRKGKGGGLRLAKDPKQISLADIIETTEGTMVMSDCLFHRESCKFSRSCKFRKYLGKVQNKVHSLFANETIFDLISTN
ncbi:RrF2 family transcriptional regulator [Candidatus Margulisiibacteriota bacterium]